MSFKTMQIYFFLVIELVLRNVIPYQLPERIYFLFFLFGKREMIFGVMEWIVLW